MNGIWEDEKGARWLQVSVRAVPEKGRANAAMMQLIAKRLKLPAKNIALESGDASKLKRLRLAGMAEAVERIGRELDGYDHR